MTEKPSVAISYAKILGVHGRQDGYLEGNGYLVSWCVGHLVELAPPSAYGEQYVKWNIADLSILPEKWQYLVSASTKKQFGILKKLMHPKHFTEDTLLHSMETASADSMPEGVERQGIGTPATRAATIEKLVQKGFLERKGDKKTKVLLPTDKGKALITVMPEEIQSADMTADWETKLLRVERGEMEPETFMTEINDMISSLVNTTEAVKGASALMKNKVIGVCPNCGNSVVEREKGYFCENRECRFVLWKDNAFFKRLGKRMDAHVADRLLRDGRVRLKDCKSSKGKTYNATVLLSTEADGRSKFSLEFEGGR